MGVKTVSLKLPRMHAAQRRMFREKKRFNVGRCGRRFGKTLMAIILLCQEGGILHGQPCAWFAPISKHSAKVWREVCAELAPVIVGKNKTERVIHFIGGGELEFWSMEDIDAGKSRKYARVIIDEAELAKDLKYTWEQAISPTLLDLGGDAWFFSTPKGQTYFNELYEQGQSDDPDFDEWMSWHFPTASNRTLRNVDAYLAKQKRILPDLVYRQEYLAEVVDFGGTIIEREWIRYGVPNPKEVCSTAIGVDLAISIKEDAAFTAFVVMQATIDGKLWVRDCLKERISFHEILEKLTALGERWEPDIINIEKVQFQAAVVQEMLRKTKLNIKGCNPEKNGDKLVRFLPLQPRYRNGLIHHDSRLPRYFEQDILGFPSAIDKDIPDAMVYAFRGLRLPGEKSVGAGPRESSKYLTTEADLTGGGWGTVSEH